MVLIKGDIMEKDTNKKSDKTPISARRACVWFFVVLGVLSILAGMFIEGILFLLLGISLSVQFGQLLTKNGIKSNKYLRAGISFVIFLCFGLLPTNSTTSSTENVDNTISKQVTVTMAPTATPVSTPVPTIEATPTVETVTPTPTAEALSVDSSKATTEENSNESNNQAAQSSTSSTLYVDSCDINGYREPNAVVDIGFGDREYWAYTNEYGQLVKVTAKEIILQESHEERSNGRYCADEAKVPGTEDSDLDEGHIIADSLGGVSNAYNITPQNSTLNRHGTQAYMEDQIRKALNAGGTCVNFEALITYPDNTTQIPSRYKYTYTLNGNVVVDEFDNVNPETTVPQNNNSGNGSSDSHKSENTYVEPQAPVVQEPVVEEPVYSAPQTDMVWLSATGSKYHSINDCGRMNPNTARQITLAEAEAGGYERCSKCW